MYRLLDKYPASPQNSRHPARASTKEVVDRSGEPVEGAVEITTGRNCWEASDQRRDAKRHSKKWRFVLSGSQLLQAGIGISGLRLYRTIAHCTTCAVSRETVLSNLPIRRLKRTTHLGRVGSPLTKDISGTNDVQ